MAVHVQSALTKFVPDFGDNRALPAENQVSCMCARLTVEDLFKINEEVGANLFVGMDVNLSDVGSLRAYWNTIKHILTKYTEQYKNIYFDGRQLEKAEDVFAILGTDMLAMMASIFQYVVSTSRPGLEESKKSESESAQPSSDSGGTAGPAV